MSSAPTKHSETWTTQIGVILAVTGSAVGLGNFLRFPGLAAITSPVAMLQPAVALLEEGLGIGHANDLCSIGWDGRDGGEDGSIRFGSV